MSRQYKRLNLSAFTLVEMLVVIAIIGILAAILLPVINMARKKARETTARSDIANLEQALAQYTMDFGALPPDKNDDLTTASGVDFSKMDTPNECLVWFLTRTYSRAVTAAGVPWATGTGWDPATATPVFSRVAGGPYFSPKAKQIRDYDEDKFQEFVDPWGMPYFYRAYYNVDSQPLHNAEGGDLYSVGVNEKSQGLEAVGSTTLKTYPFNKPYGAAELGGADPKGVGLWGATANGNDIEGGNGNTVLDAKDRDDICNWQ